MDPFYYMFQACLCYAVLSVSVPCSIVITCWKRADPLALLFVAFYCVLSLSYMGISVQVWYLVVSISDLCLPLYFPQTATKRHAQFPENIP